MKHLLLLLIFFSGYCFGQDQPTGTTNTAQLPDFVSMADRSANAVNALLLAKQGECIYGDCQNTFGVSNLPGGGKFFGLYKEGIGTGFSLIENPETDVEVFSNYIFGVGIENGFCFMYDNKDDSYMLYDYDGKLGFGLDLNSKKYFYFNIVNGAATNGQHIYPNGEDLGCVGGDCRNGYGVYRYGNGDVYSGKFIGGKPNGLGEDMVKSSGQLSWGIFTDGKLQGQGVRVWDEYYYYFGEFKDNKRHGYGVLRTSEDTFKAGQWVNDEFQDEVAPATSNVPVETIEVQPVVVTPLSQADQDAILACNKEKYCLRKLYVAKYDAFRAEYEYEEALQMTANYLMGQDLLVPEMTFPLIMASYQVPNDVMDLLPVHLQQRIKQEAQGVAVDYQAYINSPETKKAVEKLGGKMN